MPRVLRLNRPLRLTALLLGLALAAPAFAQTPAKRALVIAIGGYPQDRFGGPSYRPLNALHDTTLVVPALRTQGFEVATLTDGRATRTGILDAFARLAEAARPGDLLFVHYSGHGHQVTDVSGDEPDGYDEVLVPYDAPAGPPEGYRGEGHILDDDLGTIVEDLRRRVYPGGEVVLTFDACHSGSATRGDAPTRSGGDPIGPPGPGARGDERGVIGVDAVASGTRGGTDELAPYIYFSAAAHDQLDQEMRDPESGLTVGPLSYALAYTLAQLGDGETYRRLFERVEAAIAAHRPNQTPQAEGDLDTAVFSGRAVVQQPYVPVVAVDGGEVIVGSGVLAGLSEGSRVAFYPAGTQRPEGDPLAEGEVMATTPYEALVALAAPPSVDLADAWGFVTWQALGDVRVPVVLQDGLGEADAIRAALASVGIVQLVEAEGAPAEHLDVRAEGGELVIAQAADGAVLHRLPRGDAGAREAADRLGAYARARYLQRIQLDHPDLAVRLAVHPADLRVNAFGRCTPSEAAVAAGAAARGADRPANVFRVGETYALRVSNTGHRPAYVSIVSVRPDGDMTVLYPLGRARDNVIQPGASFLLPNCYAAGAPAGPDVLKAFVTDQPLDLTLLVQGPSATRSERGLLDDLFEAAYLDSEAMAAMETRSETVGAAPSLATTTEVVLQVLDGAP